MRVQPARRRRAAFPVFVSLVPALLVLATGCARGPRGQDAGALMPPEPRREFRAAWVATVGNIDWPTKPGLSTGEQQRQAIEILDTAVDLKLNAIVLQVRTSADALYESNLEPWSAFLTGKQGQRPAPYYDPLRFWVDEAHRRGLELHAWFNPYRAGTPGRGEAAPTHLSKTRPELVKQYGPYLWLDPGEPEAGRHTLNVFLDVVRRYDIDGVHIDDYFYPYPINDEETKQRVDFPDDASWQRYVESGGKLSRDDWRRDNINRQIRGIYQGIKRVKPHVQFGISPFGIWRPGHPASVRGLDQYDALYADAKLWLNEGWLDYWTPQLYWKATAPQQPYRDLLEWWVNQNTKGRNVWPGLFTSRVSERGGSAWAPRDLLDQIEITRATRGATGHVHFSMKALRRDSGGIATALAKGPYNDAALIPAAPWLDDERPGAPRFDVTWGSSPDVVNVSWRQRGNECPRVWAVYAKHQAAWKLHVFPAGATSAELARDVVLGPVTAVSVAAVDRAGNQSKPAPAKTPANPNR